jgi:hypothetical protein
MSERYRRFEPRVGGRVYFFERNESGTFAIHGKVFVYDEPHVLAFSFTDPRMTREMEIAEREWMVRWTLEPAGDGCRITFVHRGLSGPLMWGLGEGWHKFMDQLVAYFDGELDALMLRFARDAAADEVGGLRLYREHVAQELRAWGSEMATQARTAIRGGVQDDALAQIDCLDLAIGQLHRIARQEGARPDYALDGVTPPM